MTDYQVEITKIERHTHNVLDIYTTKPEAYQFKAGQATEVRIDQFKWRNEGRFFAFASSPSQTELEFLIKMNLKQDLVINKILSLKPGDKLRIGKPVGGLHFKGSGTFIAGGVGITPFIAMFRDLKRKGKLAGNTLIYANNTAQDIIFREELRALLGDNFINILNENTKAYAQGYITKSFIKAHAKSLNKHFYLCGPPVMVQAVERYLEELAVDDELIIK